MSFIVANINHCLQFEINHQKPQHQIKLYTWHICYRTKLNSGQVKFFKPRLIEEIEDQSRLKKINMNLIKFLTSNIHSCRVMFYWDQPLYQTNTSFGWFCSSSQDNTFFNLWSRECIENFETLFLFMFYLWGTFEIAWRPALLHRWQVFHEALVNKFSCMKFVQKWWQHLKINAT